METTQERKARWAKIAREKRLEKLEREKHLNHKRVTLQQTASVSQLPSESRRDRKRTKTFSTDRTRAQKNFHRSQLRGLDAKYRRRNNKHLDEDAEDDDADDDDDDEEGNPRYAQIAKKNRLEKKLRSENMQNMYGHSHAHANAKSQFAVPFRISQHYTSPISPVTTQQRFYHNQPNDESGAKLSAAPARVRKYSHSQSGSRSHSHSHSHSSSSSSNSVSHSSKFARVNSHIDVTAASHHNRYWSASLNHQEFQKAIAPALNHISMQAPPPKRIRYRNDPQRSASNYLLTYKKRYLHHQTQKSQHSQHLAVAAAAADHHKPRKQKHKQKPSYAKKTGGGASTLVLAPTSESESEQEMEYESKSRSDHESSASDSDKKESKRKHLKGVKAKSSKVCTNQHPNGRPKQKRKPDVADDDRVRSPRSMMELGHHRNPSNSNYRKSAKKLPPPPPRSPQAPDGDPRMQHNSSMTSTSSFPDPVADTNRQAHDDDSKFTFELKPMSETTRQISIDRYGFPMQEQHPTNANADPADGKHAADEDMKRREELRKEGMFLLEWQNILFRGQSTTNAKGCGINWSRIDNKSHGDRNKLKELIKRGGIPQQLRAYVWCNLCRLPDVKALSLNRGLYDQLVSMVYSDKSGNNYDEIIWKDINRTFRENLRYGAVGLGHQNGDDINKDINKLGKNDIQSDMVLNIDNCTDAQRGLYNVLASFCVFNPDIGYCQGMQAVTALLLMYMMEEDVFHVLDIIAKSDKYGRLASHWDMSAIHLRFYQFDMCVREYLPKLYKHLQKYDITNVSMFGATQFFITIFISANEIPFDVIVRIWDIYLFKGIKAVFQFGIAYLKFMEKPLLACDADDTLLTMLNNGFQNIVEKQAIDRLVHLAMNTKIKTKEIEKWAKKYAKEKEKGK